MQLTHGNDAAIETRGTAPAVRRGGFTLLELIVVMGIIVLLAVLTAISIRGISKDARRSLATNRLIAALGSARAEAIRSHKTTLLTFDVVKDADAPGQVEQIELTLLQSTGNLVPAYTTANTSVFFQQFLPVAGLEPTRLAPGIKVAGPWTDRGDGGVIRDSIWVTVPGGPAVQDDGPSGEAPGNFLFQEFGTQICVMFGPDGSLVTRDPQAPSAAGVRVYPWHDRDFDGVIDRINHPNLGATRSFFELNDTRDEMGMSIVNFVSVYDDTQARDTLGTAGWTNPDTRNVVLSDWIDEQANRIHFNRYTGLAEVANR